MSYSVYQIAVTLYYDIAPHIISVPCITGLKPGSAEATEIASAFTGNYIMLEHPGEPRQEDVVNEVRKYSPLEGKGPDCVFKYANNFLFHPKGEIREREPLN